MIGLGWSIGLLNHLCREHGLDGNLSGTICKVETLMSNLLQITYRYWPFQVMISPGTFPTISYTLALRPTATQSFYKLNIKLDLNWALTKQR